MRTGQTVILLFVLFLSATMWVSALAFAHGLETQAGQDDVLKRIGVDEKLGSAVPTGLTFTDQVGKAVKLGDYFGGKPVLLTLNYYGCPMLCPITLKNLAESMTAVKGLTPGRDYRVVTLSINPHEDARAAAERAKETYGMLGGMNAEGEPGSWWPFLYGGKAEVNAVTEATGFRYVDLGGNNFAHPAVLIVLTPDGKISRYLYGVKVDGRDLRLALIEAAGGRIGASTALNRVILFCYHYDPVGKKYQLAATRIMKAGGAVTLILLALLIVGLLIKEKKIGPTRRSAPTTKL